MADNDKDTFGNPTSYIVRGQDVRPIPDPTILTTEATRRLEESMRNLIKTEIEHQGKLFDEKLEGARMQLAERMSGATKQISEKLARVESQFEMLSERTSEQKRDVKDALDAALMAQKDIISAQTASLEKNIDKSEAATSERIKTVESLLTTYTHVSDDKIDDLKNRVIAIEAVKLGNVEQVAATRAGSFDTRAGMASIISIITTVIAVASIVVTIIVVLKP